MKGKQKTSPKIKPCLQRGFKSAPFGIAFPSFPPKGFKVLAG